MGTLVEKLNYLKETKTAIKNAITAKGVSVSDTDTFRSYAGKIGEIQSGSSGGGSENNAFFDFSEYTDSYIYKYIRYIDLSSLDTSNTTNMASMFYNCSGFTSLDLSSFVTSKVTGMSYMFYGCSGLTSLDLSSFDTSNVTSSGMNHMFNGCSSLQSLDLSSFDTSKVIRMNYMFSKCSKLATLILGNNWASNESLPSFDLSPCTALSHDSLVDIMNKLATRTNSPTIKLSTESKNLLTASEKAIATGKGWTIA